MTNADPEVIYKELAELLTIGEDPSGKGQQSTTYGNGLTIAPAMQPIDRYNIFTAPQLTEATTTQPASVRPINVNIRTPDKIGPGIVSEPIAVQALRQAVDPTEWENNVDSSFITDPNQLERNSGAQMLWVSIAAGSNDAQIKITEELEAQILDLFSGSGWSTTRANMIAALKRPGSRSEEIFGFQVSYPEDFSRAEQWRQDNGGDALGPPLMG